MIRSLSSVIAIIVGCALAQPRDANGQTRAAGPEFTAARFAESSGGGRTLLFKDAWRYRDYVIESFNRDKPFDEFIVEQIAGDLLPSESIGQRNERFVATGFLVLGPTNYEEQDKEQLRMDVVDEQIDTVGRAFLGLTLGCARCHDHKFDPVPTTDYYALAGIFRSTKTLTPGNVSGFVERPLDDEQARVFKQHDDSVKAAVASLKAAQTELKKLRDQLAGKPGRPDADKLPGIVVDDLSAKLVGQWTHSTFEPRFLGDGYIHDANSGKGEKSVTFAPDLPEAGMYEVRVSYTASSNRATNVPVVVQHADGSTAAVVDERRAPSIDNLFHSVGRFRFERGRSGSVTISNEGTNGHVIADAAQFVPVGLLDRPPAAGPTDGPPTTPPNETVELAQRERELESKVKQLETELSDLKKRAPSPPPLAMAVQDEAETGDFSVCIRGSVHNLGNPVPRGFLTVLGPETATATIARGQSGRRELAQWLASPDNPLAARVIVNRVWHYLFGAGLVRTTDSFGSTGELPSHPELLDWLAMRFVEQGWSIKRLMREIALTRVYQLSSSAGIVAAADSEPTARRPGSPANVRAAEGVDLENRLLSRQNRRRLDAESIRDTILVVSGQLDLSIGGSTIRHGTDSEFGYQFDTLRRSVYVPVFRNTLLELLEVFDFADPNLVTGRRNTSTLPTQALYLMNSPFVMDQARHAAQAILAEPGLDDEARIERAYRHALARVPRPEERALAVRYVTARRDGSAADAQRQMLDRWTNFFHALFSCVDFRYLN